MLLKQVCDANCTSTIKRQMQRCGNPARAFSKSPRTSEDEKRSRRGVPQMQPRAAHKQKASQVEDQRAAQKQNTPTPRAKSRLGQRQSGLRDNAIGHCTFWPRLLAEACFF